MAKKLLVQANLDYIQGHLRYGHKELEVDAEEWNKLDEEERKQLIDDQGDFILDDYELEDHGDITDIKVSEPYDDDKKEEK